MSLVVQRARLQGRRFFFQFGLHCATHQIRVILISCIVITSLFYPALDLYSSANSLSVYEALTASSASGGIPAHHDLSAIWTGHPALRVHQDAVTRAKCRDGHTLRTERILVQSAFDEDDGALNQRSLLSLLDLEASLTSLASADSSPCLKGPDARCIVISPLAYWHHDRNAIQADPSVLNTITSASNVSVAGVPLNPSMVLAGRGSYDHHVAGDKMDYADYLVLTYFFPQGTCWSASTDHLRWAHSVQAIHNQEPVIQIPDGTLMALEYNPRQSSSKSWSAVSASVYLAYIAFFAYVAWSARFMHAVHSRIGVTFTALVEIAVSTITSLSVCALVGFKITLVPWELLPIVIVFVGAENMFNLVDAVGKTSVTLSVKQRIAEGLSRAGTSNTLKVVSYNTILGIIAVYGTGAVRQFCIFAIVVLVAHWFLAHTFFIAVLSIDIARLELDELLRHDSSLVPSLQSTVHNSKQPRSRWQKFMMTMQKSLRGRAATNISLLMLLGIVGSLYYTTYTASSSAATTGTTPPRAGVSPRVRSSNARPNNRAATILPTAEHIWKTLNPVQTPQLHVLLESPMLLTFTPPTSTSYPHTPNSPLNNSHSTPYRSRSTKTFGFFLWLTSIMLVPIAVTTSALYGLLLYLLKNTELLEAQRHRQEAEPLFAMDRDGDSASSPTQGVNREVDATFSTLVRGMGSDVELMGSSEDGKVVVCVGLRDEVVVWADTSSSGGKKKCVVVDGVEAILRMASVSASASFFASSSAYFASGSKGPSIVCLAVDRQGRYFALGTRNGIIVVWSVERSLSPSSSSSSPSSSSSSSSSSPSGGSVKVRPLPLLCLKGSIARVTEMVFVPPIGWTQAQELANGTKTPPVHDLVELPEYLRRTASGSGLAAAGSATTSTPISSSTTTASSSSSSVTLLATYENGIAARWGVASGVMPSVTVFKPSTLPATSPVHSTSLLHVSPDDRVVVAFQLENGALDLVETGDYEPTLLPPLAPPSLSPHPSSHSNNRIRPTTSALVDPVTRLHACRVRINGTVRFVVVAATLLGVVSVWDGGTGECVFVFEDAYPGVGKVRVNALSGSGPQGGEVCRSCGMGALDGIVIAFSVDAVVQFSKLVVGDDGLYHSGQGGQRRCCCHKGGMMSTGGVGATGVSAGAGLGGSSPIRIAGGNAKGRPRSRSDSNGSSSHPNNNNTSFPSSSPSPSSSALSSSSSQSQLSSPIIPRARLLSSSSSSSSSMSAVEASTTAAFPVSGHGVHSRRASEKESGRRSSEYLNIIPPFPGASASSSTSSSSISTSSGGSPPTSGLGGTSGEWGGYGNESSRSGSTTPTKSSHSVWRNGVVVTMDDVTVERGGWEVIGKKFVGIRRRARGHGNANGVGVGSLSSSSAKGLSRATLERWEVWTFDPSPSSSSPSSLTAGSPLRISAISNLLSSKEQETTNASGLSSSLAGSTTSSPRTSLSSTTSSSSISTSGVPRLPFTRVSPVLTTSSLLLAGFGNTIGVFDLSPPSS